MAIYSPRTIVRQVKIGGDPSGHRFVILSELLISGNAFAFQQLGSEMTMADTCLALVAQGIPEAEAAFLLDDAIAAFRRHLKDD